MLKEWLEQTKNDDSKIKLEVMWVSWRLTHYIKKRIPYGCINANPQNCHKQTSMCTNIGGIEPQDIYSIKQAKHVFWTWNSTIWNIHEVLNHDQKLSSKLIGSSLNQVIQKSLVKQNTHTKNPLGKKYQNN